MSKRPLAPTFIILVSMLLLATMASWAQGPAAEFSWSTGADMTVSFTDQSTGSPTSFFWDFGDGNVSSSQNPTHKYYAPGTYTVALTVTNGAETDSVHHAVKVSMAPPTADFTYTEVSALVFQYTDQSTGGATAFEWDFGDGNVSMQQNPRHEYSLQGDYTVRLIAINMGGSDTTWQTVPVHLPPPTAEFSWKSLGNLTVKFTDEASASATSVAWDFGDGNATFEQNPTHQYAAPGSYTVAFTATNLAGSDSVHHLVTVSEQHYRPTAFFTWQVGADRKVAFTNKSEGVIASYQWDFGDGQSSTEKHPEHQYASDGSYTVSLTITGPGGTHSTSNSVTIKSTQVVPGPEDSGGPLDARQARYDVKYYDLDLNVDPDAKQIDGTLTIRVEALDNLDSLVLDLEHYLAVDAVQAGVNGSPLQSAIYDHNRGKVVIALPVTAVAGSEVEAAVTYHGGTCGAVGTHWSGGVLWEKAFSGKPWISVSSNYHGADSWFPCKDHPSDEPDSVALHFTVPEPLVCVSNGVSRGMVDNGDSTLTYNWFVSTPINNYGVSFYLSDFDELLGSYSSVNGQQIPFSFWISSDYELLLEAHLATFRAEFNFLESMLGPFPFGMEKHAWAHAPGQGMPHQTVLPYSGGFGVNSWGFDTHHFKVLAQEWWGNLVTPKDWADAWIKEGLGAYMEALYVEHISGQAQYHNYMSTLKPSNSHIIPLAPQESMTYGNAYSFQNPTKRGAWTMQTLRYHLGDDMFRELLWHWAYPGGQDMDNTLGRQCRLVDTDEMKTAAEALTGRDLGPFFSVFMRETGFPRLDVQRTDTQADFTWVTDTGVALDLNVPVSLNGFPMDVEMTAGTGILPLATHDELVIDPYNWILMADPNVTSDVDESGMPREFALAQNYPNPFNPTTEIVYDVANNSRVKISVYDMRGRLVSIVVNGYHTPGAYTARFTAEDLASGLYICCMEAGGFTAVKKMMLLK